MALIEVQHLKKYFDVPNGTLHAVDDVSFKIEKGTTMGVVGESGCGKSTLGTTLIHLQESTGGKILFEGRDVTHLDKKELRTYREDVQIIFQDPYSSLNPRYNIARTIMEPLEISGRFKSKEEIRERQTGSWILSESRNVSADLIRMNLTEGADSVWESAALWL